MLRTTTLLCLAAIVALPACVSQDAYRRALTANDKLQDEREALSAHVRELTQQNEKLSRDVQRLGANAADAAWIDEQKKRLNEMIARLGGTSGGSIDIEGVSVREGGEGIIVQVQGEVLFASGKAELTSTGRKTLEQLAPALLREGKGLRVEGHTDNDPIVHSKWKTNLRLSSERALSVAEYLIGAGMNAENIGVAGYGEHRPIDPGNDAAAKQANRRVEILILDR